MESPTGAQVRGDNSSATEDGDNHAANKAIRDVKDNDKLEVNLTNNLNRLFIAGSDEQQQPTQQVSQDCEDNPTKYLYKRLSMIVDPISCLDHHKSNCSDNNDNDIGLAGHHCATTATTATMNNNNKSARAAKTNHHEQATNLSDNNNNSNNINNSRKQSISTNGTLSTNNTQHTNRSGCAIQNLDMDKYVVEGMHNVVVSDCLLDEEDNNGECSRRNSHSIPERNLLYCSLERMKLKDFGCEIRALMDVEQFVHQAILLLDVADIIVEDIVDSMLRKIISVDRDISQRVINEAKNALFIHKSASLLSRTIQGIQISTDPMMPGLDYDQSWLCSMCNLPTISKRHVAIARLKHFVNMGKNAHEVRFFILIVTPRKEKGTKNALETGRTFATIFSDIDFRQVLLNAHNETEFKNALLSYTKKLSNANTNFLESANAATMQLQSIDHCNGSPLNNNNNNSTVLQSTSIGHHGKYLVATNNGHQQHQQNQQNQSALLITIVNNNDSNAATATTTTAKHTSKLMTSSDSLNNLEPLSNTLQTFSGSQADDNGGKEQIDDVDMSNATYRVVVQPSSLSTNGPHHTPNKRTVCLKLSKTDKRRKYIIGNGLCADIRRRFKFFSSDFTDGFVGPKTVHKTISTIVFLYFGILLPTMAFGVLNTTNTNGKLGDIRKAIIGQSIGGFLFALFGGQPLVIIMTTAPLCLYTKVIYTMCEDYNYPFLPMYAAVGLWNAFFLTLYSIFDVSRLMKWCTRSTEEIFALFIAIAFGVDAGRDLIKNFNRYYYSNACLHANSTLIMPSNNASAVVQLDKQQLYSSSANSINISSSGTDILDLEPICRRESSLLFIILMFGTLWLALALYNFNRTPYLQASKRDMLADYALPSAVIVMSFVGSYVFEEIHVEKFAVLEDISFKATSFYEMPLIGFLVAMGLGFTLSLLFFMDQNISAAMVNSPQNKLKKGCSYHYDLLVVGLLNGLLTLYGLPMMHGVLPHSPLHVRSLADVEERVEQGHVKEIIINVRETRVTGIISHILICMSIFLVPYPIAYIPTAVLDGLFLYMAATSLDGLQMFERITLLFMEQSAYPPNHYIRRCPQRKIHEFTLVQLFQLVVMCFFGFSPSNTIEMFFPVVILLMLPFRSKLVPYYIEDKYLEALDGEH